MQRWKLGALGAIAALPLAGSAQSQAKLWDVQNLNAPQNYMSNVTVEQTGALLGDAALQLRFGGLWAQVGQNYTLPVNWATYTGFCLVLQNLENRDISFGVRFDRNAGLTDYVASAFLLRAGETKRFYLDLSNFDPMTYGMVSPMPVIPGFYTPVFPWQTKPLNTVFKWQVYSRDAQPTRVLVSSMYGQNGNYSTAGIVDRYGQFSRATHTWKVASAADLQRQRTDEDTDLAANPGSGESLGSNSFTGTPTGKWRITKTANGKFYFVTPAGKYFWSLGLTSVGLDASTITTGRENLFTGLPQPGDPRTAFYGTVTRNSVSKQTFNHYAANISEKFGATWATDWKDVAKRRIKSWGFNTIGAGSDMNLLPGNTMSFVWPLTTCGFPTKLPTPHAYWGPLPDPFSATFVDWMKTQFAIQLAGLGSDQRLMGIVVDCEQVWGMRNGSMRDKYEVPLGALSAGASQPAKGSFANRLQVKYGTITALNTAWGTSLTSWTELRTTPVNLTDAQVAAAQADLSSFLYDFAKYYYSRVRTALKTVAPNALYLGGKDAYPWAPDEVFSAESPYVDVISIDHYDDADHTPWAFFASLPKPVLIAEFSFNGRDGNAFPNLTLPGCETPDQASRAVAARRYLANALANKNIVGAHWYRYMDFPIAGKAEHDQNYAFGMVDVTDRPYPEMVDMFRQFSNGLYATRGR